jgi:hypothetical protein
MTTHYWQSRLFEFYNKIKDKEDISVELELGVKSFKRVLREGRDSVVPQQTFDYDFSQDKQADLDNTLSRVDEAIMIGLSILDK